MSIKNNLQNQIFGYWKVLYLSSAGRNKKTMWHCKCLLCGKESDVDAYSLINKISTKCRSCATRLGKTKPYSGDPIKYIFKGMKQRCYNSKHNSYDLYGEKGITICDEWLSDPKTFYDWAYENGYKKGMSIERIDVNKGYSPENCIIIPKEDQSKNRSSNYMIEIDNQILCLADWCRIYNLPYSTIVARIKHGMTYNEALNTPIKSANKELYCPIRFINTDDK